MADNYEATIVRAVASLPETVDEHEVGLRVVQTGLEGLVDPTYVEGARRTVPGDMHVYGVRVPQLRDFAKALAARYKGEADALGALALAIWDVGSREHQLLALFTLARARLTAAESWEVGTLMLPDVGNWESCDQLCNHLLGEALSADATYMDALEGWIEHPTFWKRRAALVTTTRLRRMKGPDAEAEALDGRALAMCGALLDDPEPYVAKAVDWAVREVIKRHPALGAAWMFEQAQRGLSRTGRSTLRKSAAKLPADERARFLELIDADE